MSETFLNPPVPEWFSRLFYLTRIRIAAEKEIVDEKRYFDVMTADPIEEVRRRAVCRLTDQALLRQAAERDPKETVRAEAAKRLTDQEYLFHMLFSDPSDDVQIAASMALTDDDLCFRTAMSHPIPAVCVNAMKQIGDQQLLARILTESEDRELRRETALAITDPAVAKELVQGMPSDHEDFPTPRVFLISAIDDQDMLTELALNDPDYKARRAAAARVTAPEVLMRIIRDETEYDVVRAAAAGQIRDQETLRDLADTYYHKLAPYDIGEEALKHIEDQAYLKSVAEDYCLMHCLREAAATHVTDQEILEAIAGILQQQRVADIRNLRKSAGSDSSDKSRPKNNFLHVGLVLRSFLVEKEVKYSAKIHILFLSAKFYFFLFLYLFDFSYLRCANGNTSYRLFPLAADVEVRYSAAERPCREPGRHRRLRA